MAKPSSARWCIHSAAVTSMAKAKIPLYGPSRKVEGQIPNTKFMTYQTKSYREMYQVPNQRFDTKFLRGVNGIKMDIEGAEHSILDSFPKLPDSVTKMVMEYHFIKDRSMSKFHARMDNLRKHFSSVNYPQNLDDLRDRGIEEFPHFFDRLVFCLR